MQDRAIVAIGEWQLEKSRGIEEVDLYIVVFIHQLLLI